VKQRAAIATGLGLLRTARKATLATVMPGTGAPYASLVLVAADTDNRPLFLFSTLALHTQNLSLSSRASILLDGTDAAGDPMAGGRITLMGDIHRTTHAAVRATYLMRQPLAAAYADFADFGFFQMTVASAHLIEGFGRIVDIAGSDWHSTPMA
jgi:heme iron utilization protein